MEIETRRIKRGYESALSEFWVNGILRGYIPEDTDRLLSADMPLEIIQAEKIYGRTAIPYSIKGKPYIVGLTVSKKFGNVLWPELLNVPGYGGIRPHKGNFVIQTDGCQMPGETFDQDKLGYFRVWNSAKVFDPFKVELVAALHAGEICTWAITNGYKFR